jgi:polyhydroxyalkanoate synthase
MRAQPTPYDTVFKDGTAELLHFRAKAGAERSAAQPLLLVPSIINRWYVLDLFEGSSVVEALVEAGIDTYCLEWGVAQYEDRFFEWDDFLARLERVVRATKRHSGSRQLV